MIHKLKFRDIGVWWAVDQSGSTQMRDRLSPCSETNETGHDC